MSLHKSLKRKDTLYGQRNVLNRAEKIKKLIEKGLWKEADSVFKLPKVKIVRLKQLKKEKKVEEKTVEKAGQK